MATLAEFDGGHFALFFKKIGGGEKWWASLASDYYILDGKVAHHQKNKIFGGEEFWSFLLGKPLFNDQISSPRPTSKNILATTEFLPEKFGTPRCRPQV